MEFLKSRKFRQGSFATIITVSGVVLILMLYYVFAALGDRYDWRYDLTAEQMFNLTPESVDFLTELDKDVNIHVLNNEDDFVDSAQMFTFQANEVIKKYKAAGSRINLEYVDILRNPTFVARFTNLDLAPNQILIECPDTGRYRLIEFYELYNIATDQAGQAAVRSSKAEQVMTSAISYVVSDEQIRVSILSGYNQGDISDFAYLLAMNNYDIVYENLATVAEIDPLATIALLAAPLRDISEDDLKKLDRFLENNGVGSQTVFYITGASQTPMSHMPNLRAWVNEWGIAVHDSVLVEMDSAHRFAIDDPFIAFVDYSYNETSMELSQAVRAQSLLAAAFYSSPLSVYFEERDFRRVSPLLQTSESSFILADDAQIPEGDYDGPHPVLILSTMTRYQATGPRSSHVLVSGSFSSFNQTVLGELNFANSEYFLQILDALSGREDTIRIQDKNFIVSTMQMTVAEHRVLTAITMVILPMGTIAMGFMVWLRRRHR